MTGRKGAKSVVHRIVLVGSNEKAYRVGTLGNIPNLTERTIDVIGRWVATEIEKARTRSAGEHFENVHQR